VLKIEFLKLHRAWDLRVLAFAVNLPIHPFHPYHQIITLVFAFKLGPYLQAFLEYLAFHPIPYLELKVVIVQIDYVDVLMGSFLPLH